MEGINLDFNVLGPWAISLAIMGVGFRALWDKYNKSCDEINKDRDEEVAIREQRIAMLVGLFQEKVRVDMEQIAALKEIQQALNAHNNRVDRLEEKIDGIYSSLRTN